MIDFDNMLGCDSTAADFAFTVNHVNSPLRIEDSNEIAEENSEFNFTIRPIPSTGFFDILLTTLDSTSETESYIIVNDITGRIVYTQKHSHSKKVIIDISKLSKGMYYISVRMKNNTRTKKIIVY